MSLDWTVGQIITAERLNRRLPVDAVKGNNATRTSSATPTSDTELILVLAAFTTYNIQGVLRVSNASNTTADFQYRWSWAGGTAIVFRSSSGPVVGLAGAGPSGDEGQTDWGVSGSNATSPSASQIYGVSTSLVGIHIDDRIIVGNADITLTLQLSQGTSDAATTTLFAGSWVTAYPVDYDGP